MRFFLIHMTLFLASSLLVSCQSQNETFISQEIAQIPACGLECLSHTVSAVGCSLLNTTCQCASPDLITITSKCMMANCTLEEGVELDKVQAAICERPYESRNRLITVTTIVCGTITYTAVAIRLLTRYCLNQRYGMDDWFIIAAASTDAVFTSFGAKFERNGFGEHVWEIDINMIPQLLLWFYICEIFYVLTISLIKISILIFYLQVFPTHAFRIRCWLVMGFIVASSIAFTFTTIFQCSPVSFVYNKNLQGGKCVNFNTATWVNGAFHIFQDLLIIALPISEVRKLQLERKKKISLYIMFALGGFVCVFSMVRLYTIKTFGLTADPTWDNIPMTFWTTLETTTAVVCTCLPSIRAGLLRVCPRMFGSVAHNSTQGAVENKGSVAHHERFASFSISKPWHAKIIESTSSLSMRDEENQSPISCKGSAQFVELQRIGRIDRGKLVEE